MSIVREHFEFELKNAIENYNDGYGNPKNTKILYLFEPDATNYPLYFKLKSHVSRAAVHMQMESQALTGAATRQQAEIENERATLLEDTSAEELTKQIVGSALMLMKPDVYLEFMELFQSLLCKTGICALDESNKAFMKPTWLAQVHRDDLEELARQYAERFLFPKHLISK